MNQKSENFNGYRITRIKNVLSLKKARQSQQKPSTSNELNDNTELNNVSLQSKMKYQICQKISKISKWHFKVFKNISPTWNNLYLYECLSTINYLNNHIWMGICFNCF